MRRQGGQRLSAAQQERQRREMRGRRQHPPVQAQVVQHFIDHADKAARRHQHVRTPGEILHRQRVLARRQAGRVNQAGIAALPHGHALQGRRGQAAGCDHQVDLARHQHVGHQAAVGLAEDQSQSRRRHGQRRDRLASQRDLEVIGQPQRDRAPAEPRRARPRQRQALPALVQRLADDRPQFARPQAGRQATPGAHEQRVGIEHAQPRQRRADRRLGHAQAQRGAARAALVVDRLEHLEQVQVGRLDIDLVHIIYRQAGLIDFRPPPTLGRIDSPPP